MDTLKKEQAEAQERLKVLYEERDGLTAEYKDKKKQVDELKEQLQKKINDYSKLSEKGQCFEHHMHTACYKFRTKSVLLYCVVSIILYRLTISSISDSLCL